tara:strand:- start:1474 stop:2217 length:744 start_codon:yes stop_codon:yes gene_type:complete
MTYNKVEGIFGLPVLQDNIIWLWVERGSVVVIDPSISEPVINWIYSNGLQLDSILQTHHHIDHIGGTKEILKEWPKTKVIASAKEKHRIPFQNISVKDKDTLNILGKRFLIIELIGHTKSHISFYSEDFINPILFVGDTLFSGGCGRIFEGTYEQMFNSLKRISLLPKETIIYCAHEYTKSNLLWALDIYPDDQLLKDKLFEVEKKIHSNLLTIPTTLKEEMNINLFLRAKNLNEFIYLRAKKDGLM